MMTEAADLLLTFTQQGLEEDLVTLKDILHSVGIVCHADWMVDQIRQEALSKDTPHELRIPRYRAKTYVDNA